MDLKSPEDITFQVTVGQLALVSSGLSISSFLPKQDIRITIYVGDMSKITCSGKLSWNHKKIVWNHPFLFSTPPFMTVVFSLCILPKKLTSKWNKQPLGGQMVTSVADLLAGNTWQCNVPELSMGPAILSIICKRSDELIVLDEHNCLKALEKYKLKLYKSIEWFKNVAITSTEIEVELARLDLCPIGHVNHTSVLHDLGTALIAHYVQQGNVSDLNKAIEIQQIRLNLCPLGHPEHGEALGSLAISLWKYYCLQRNHSDLNRLIEMQQKWLDLYPSGDTNHALALGELALSLWERYCRQGDITDLRKSIEIGERRLASCLPDDPELHNALNNLSLSMHAHFQRQGNLADLSKAIDLQEKSLKLRPPDHHYHGQALENLAYLLRDHSYQTNSYSDFQRTIKLFNEALAFYPVHFNCFASVVAQLAITILFLSPKFHTPDQLPSLVEKTFETYRLLTKCNPAVSSDLLGATQSWVENAETYSHPSALEAYQTSLNTLDHFTSLNSSLDSRHVTMQGRVGNRANDAFSCSIRYGNYQMAVELLEQGRGILWNQLARFEISITALESQNDQGYELGRMFTRLSADLRKHAQGKGTDPYWRVREEWQRVVDEIRSLDGFSRFLSPPQFDDLQRAAERGPVIIVNASKYSCDALIILRARAPVHVPLRCSLGDVDQLSTQLSELTRDSHAYGPNRELYVKEVLRDLWTSVVEQIASVLQNDVQLPLGSRIWWCPTSKFTMLPFHAAGPHRKGGKNLMDIYISSYAPSLAALLRALDRLRSQKLVRDSAHEAEVPNTISFAAVGQANPSADTGLGQLPEVVHEIQRIRDQTNMPANVKFESITGATASVEGTVQAFRDHRWVHVACHGAQHAEKPFDSWFAMGDGKLTLMRIIQERYMNSDFAFLSACHTAKGDASTPDEVLHLAAGMQFAGFNGVIGTLWKVDDAVAHQVVTRFYKEMFKHTVVDFERAAAALNTAVIETADEVSLEKRIVFVHIGI